MITAIVIGLGDRGKVYSSYALSHPSKLKIIAGADPVKFNRNHFKERFEIPAQNLYETWENLLEVGKIADVAIIATPDHLHFEPAMRAMELGYHVLLEKPMATTQDECEKIVAKSRQMKVELEICHVLRYTKFYSKIREFIDKGSIGDIVNITMMENVSYYHYAHSYIRGNWHNKDASSPMILAKCSHDLDVMYWFANADPSEISSFGGLDHFKIDYSHLPDRCTDGCPIEDSCLYYAPRIYEDIIPLLHLTRKSGNIFEKLISKLALKFPSLKKYRPFSRINDYAGWPVSIITHDTSLEGKREALINGPYGRCVYKIEDHNVVDHQIVSVIFENGITGTLTMHGHSSEEGRFIRIDGTKGTIIGEFLTYRQHLEFIDSLSNKRSTLFKSNSIDSHGGGDQILIKDFVEQVESRKLNLPNHTQSNAAISLVSHLMAFAADKARSENTVISMKEEENLPV